MILHRTRPVLLMIGTVSPVGDGWCQPLLEPSIVSLASRHE